ncbi:MAG: DUF3267 domain-containing protein, partial [Rhodothermales bacterium]
MPRTYLEVEVKGKYDSAQLWEELTLTMEEIARFGLRWFPWITAASFLPYLLAWGFPSGPAWSGTLDAVTEMAIWAAIGLSVYAVSAVVHELLHAAAMLLVGVPGKSIRFGGRIREGIIYVHTDVAMSARAYRVVLLTPAALQGVIPIVAGTALGWLWLVLYGYVMLASAIGDLSVFRLIREIPSDATVRD